MGRNIAKKIVDWALPEMPTLDASTLDTLVTEIKQQNPVVQQILSKIPGKRTDLERYMREEYQKNEKLYLWACRIDRIDKVVAVADPFLDYSIIIGGITFPLMVLKEMVELSAKTGYIRWFQKQTGDQKRAKEAYKHELMTAVPGVGIVDIGNYYVGMVREHIHEKAEQRLIFDRIS